MIESAPEVFVSYSHKDKKWLSLIRTHLAPLDRAGRVRWWDDKKIDPGGKWKDEIRDALARAKVGLLLVTPNFLESSYIAAHELPPLLSDTTVFWLAVSASMYEITEIANYQPANDPARPLDSLRVAERNKVLVEVFKKLLDKVLKDNGPPVGEPGGADIDTDGVVWVDGVSEPGDSHRRTLALDLGFFRVRLTGAASPLVFGCNWVRVESHFENASLTEEPRIAAAPDSATAKVEYGVTSLARARVRFEATPPVLILDGSAHIDYHLQLIEIPNTTIPDAKPSIGIVEIEPQWFEVANTSPAMADQATMTGADKVLVSRFLQNLNRKRVLVEKVFPL